VLKESGATPEKGVDRHTRSVYTVYMMKNERDAAAVATAILAIWKINFDLEIGRKREEDNILNPIKHSMSAADYAQFIKDMSAEAAAIIFPDYLADYANMRHAASTSFVSYFSA